MTKWKDMPKFIKNEEVKKYYDILQKKKISLFFKRFFDIIFSILGLIVLSPFFILISLAIKLDSKGPVFYRQERVTKNNKDFRIFKFRTMVDGADKKGSLITTKNDSRITRIGKLIRKCRLDETPQLINILVGDMSFVGTRPEVRKYVDKYTDKMKATLLMRAGVTSMASIYFKDEDDIINKKTNKKHNIDDVYVGKVLPFKMKYNLDYVKDFSLFYDAKTVVYTVLAVLGLKHFNTSATGEKL